MYVQYCTYLLTLQNDSRYCSEALNSESVQKLNQNKDKIFALLIIYSYFLKKVVYTYIKFKASDKEFKGHRDSKIQLQIVDFNTVTTILVKSLQ